MATIVGTVVDSSGAVVPNGVVTLTNEAVPVVESESSALGDVIASE